MYWVVVVKYRDEPDEVKFTIRSKAELHRVVSELLDNPSVIKVAVYVRFD